MTPEEILHKTFGFPEFRGLQSEAVHHVTNGGACTWFEFVQAAFAKAGYAGAELEPVAYASFNNPVQRPMYSPLANTTFAPLGLAALPSWDAALAEFLAARSRRALEAT